MVELEKKCPICLGSGEDPEGCGCRCVTNEEKEACAHLGCVSCECAGCGGSCTYCGGTGLEKDWQPGGPYERQQSDRV
jgi:hypothetical protein